MDNAPVVVLVDPNTVVKQRIKSIFADQNIKIYEAGNRQDVLAIMSDHNYKIDLIITDIEINTDDSFDGISLIKLVKSKSSSIPVVVLTSISRKEVITRCLLEGTADYILKPFEDDYLREKLLKYINVEKLTELTVLKFTLSNFLTGEIHKAKKGNYSFSLLLVNFNFVSDEGQGEIKNEFYKHAESIYKEIKSVFWESDLYIQHGFQSHLGFFPFCGKENTAVIGDKIAGRFEVFKASDPKLLNYSINRAFATYPEDGTTVSELLSALISRTTD